MPFKFEQTSIEGLIVVQPQLFGDERGFFQETYHKGAFAEAGITEDFVQDNHSRSKKGILRGIHFQRAPMAQAKLVRVTNGSVWDVAVDLRKGSPTFGQWFGLELSAENKTMLFIPKGFGHGFITLEDDTDFLYKCSNGYSPEHDGGIRWNDPDVGILWPQVDCELILSAKDQVQPFLKEIL